MKKSLITLALLSISSTAMANNYTWDTNSGQITDSQGNVYRHNDDMTGGSQMQFENVHTGEKFVVEKSGGNYKVYIGDSGAYKLISGHNVDATLGQGVDGGVDVPNRLPPTWGGDNVDEGANVPDRDLPTWGGDSVDVPVHDEGASMPQVNPDYSRSISAVEQDLFLFKQEVNQRFLTMEDRIDQVGASLHAVTNARPMVSAGQTAFGVGMGFSGSVEAIAVGVGHAFGDSGWSASGTINHATGTGNVGSDTSAGFGVQFAF